MPSPTKNGKYSRPPFILSIEGNIGSGKSTLLRHLNSVSVLKEKHPEWVFLQEPVDDWEKIRDNDGTTIIEKFYSNQDKYAFSFQIMAYISRLAKVKKAVDENPNAIIITERSLFTDKHVFAKMLFDTGKIEDVNYQIYQTWFNTFVEDYPISGYIHVNTDPKVCCDRVNKRSRDGEDTIALEYLESCHEYHKKMMEVQDDVLTIHGNQEFEEEKDNWTSKIINWAENKYNSFYNIKIASDQSGNPWITEIPIF